MSNWIKVSDRLPEEREQVLVRYWNGQIHTSARIGNKWHFNWNDYDIDLATHWMPIEFTEEDEGCCRESEGIKNPCPYKPCTSEEDRKMAYLEECELLRESIIRQLEQSFEEINKKYGL